jgi:hypothetical protein
VIEVPVRKFRSLEEAADDLVVDRDDPRLVQRLGWVLRFTGSLSPRPSYRQGVQKFRSLEEAQAGWDQPANEGNT